MRRLIEFRLVVFVYRVINSFHIVHVRPQPHAPIQGERYVNPHAGLFGDRVDQPVDQSPILRIQAEVCAFAIVQFVSGFFHINPRRLRDSIAKQTCCVYHYASSD